MDHPVPQNLEAERAVLGACLTSRRALGEALELVSNDDWYRPAHEMIWAAIRRLEDRSAPVDAITVADELGSLGTLSRVGGHVYLFDLVQTLATATNVGHYARIVAASAVRRRLIESLTRLTQRASSPDVDLDELLEDAKIDVDVISRTRLRLVEEIPNWHAFLARYANQQQSWVIPGFLGRKDVWMVLAPPGAGKTTLSRQLCWGMAAGVHPFRPGQRIEAKRSLLIDLENDEGMAADESVDWFARFDSLGEGVGERGLVWSHPQGINVRDAADANLLDQVIGDTKPDFVALGSLYKAFTRSGDWDQAAGEARVVFDRLRARHQIAFWIEHHMPKAQDGGRKHTPFGSSVWEWWSSHGRVLEPAVLGNPTTPYRFAPFRGDRRKVECPVGFTRGGRIPWEAIWDEEELHLLTEASAA
jgi:hypothetical protein